MKKKYYLLTLSTIMTNGSLCNSTTFIEGDKLPLWKDIAKRSNELIREKGFDPVEDSTIILSMTKLTKQEFDALNNKEG
jgi:hypothetical protein